MEDVVQRSRELASTEQLAIPNGLAEMLESDNDDEIPYETDKAATPAERLRSMEELQKHLN